MYISPYCRLVLVLPNFMKFGIRGQLTNVIRCVKFLFDRFRGYGVLTPPKLPFPIDLLRRPYNSVRTAVRHCETLYSSLGLGVCQGLGLIPCHCYNLPPPHPSLTPSIKGLQLQAIDDFNKKNMVNTTALNEPPIKVSGIQGERNRKLFLSAILEVTVEFSFKYIDIVAT